jgi:CheY-like chemotaxis protein
METRGQAKKLTIRTLYDPLLGEFAHMDYRRVQQILLNLLGNAVKFSFDGGTIELSASFVRGSDLNGETGKDRTEATLIGDAEQSPIRASNALSNNNSTSIGAVGVDPRKNLIRFVVKDYGRGIEKKDFETIFQPFRQASAETERVYGGTGLGLAVTSKLINSLRGRIAVDSQEGEWTQFTVDLPYADAPVEASQLTQRLSNVTVHLVDDDNANIADMSRLFRQCSVDFGCCSSLSEMATRLRANEAAPQGRSHICLVHERLFDTTEYRQLDIASTGILLSHGPKYTVKESKGHYRSLTHVLPSVLLESFATFSESVTVTPLSHPSSAPLVRRPSKFTADSNMGQLQLLIAEDNKINQKVLIRILKRLNFDNVDVVDDGQQACDIELNKAYDVILMDIQMPVMNGIEACKVIMGREDGRPKPKIIFVTAHVADVFEA